MEFRLLGPVEVSDEGGRRLDLGTRQQRFVLAVLLLEANHVVPATRLVELLWADQPPRSARQSIQVRVSRLRGVLGPAAPIDSEGAGYRIRVDPRAVDVHRFRSLVAAAREARQDGTDEEAVRLFRDSLALWSGEPLAGTAPDEVRHQLCHGLDEARLAAVEDCLDAELRLARHPSVLDELTDLVATHPTRERMVGQLMLALHRCGQTTQALEVARSTRALLADEYGIDPGTELRELELAILRDDTALAVSSPHNAAGAATQESAEAPVPPPAPAGPTQIHVHNPAQLPPAVSGFTGRDAELHELDRLGSAGPEQPGSSGLVVVSGMGGLGKTALVLRWAHQVAGRFPDGQLYLDLRGHASAPAVRPIEALVQFLRALGFEPSSIPTDLDAATAAYRTAVAGRSLLVVLDNAADAAQVRPLLPGGADCLTLVTSRNRLAGLVARDGACRLALDTLTSEEATELLERLLGPARAAAEAEAVAALAEQCGRLPLALRIAAGFLTDNPRHPIKAYVELLRTGSLLDALTVDGDDSAAVNATFELSYQRLAPPEQRMFRLVGLVPGADLTVGAAAALAGIHPAAAGQQLSRLGAIHLVTEQDPGRYSLHDLLREYAQRTAESDEPAEDRDDATERLMAWYYLQSRAADVCLSPTLIRLPAEATPDGVPAAEPSMDTDTALAWFAGEGANLLSAVAHCAVHGPHRWAWLIAELERHHLGAVGNRVDYLTVARAAVDAAEHCGDPAALSSAYLGYSDSVSRRDPAHARDILIDAIVHAERADDPLWLASTLNDLAGVHVRLGDYEAAHTVLCGSLEQKARVSPTTGRDSAAVTNLGILALIRGNLAEAADHLRTAAHDYAELGAVRKEALALITLAEATRGLGPASEALALLDRAMGLAQESGSLRLVEAQIERAVICTELGRLDEAGVGVATLVAAAEALHDPELISRAYAARGTLRLRLGDDEAAHHDQLLAVQVARGSQDQHLLMRALIGLAQTEVALGLDEEPHEHAGAALTMAERGGARIIVADALTILASVELRRGNTAAAISRAEAALGLQLQTEHHLGKAHALRALGLALRVSREDAGAVERAERCLREAYDMFVSYGSQEAETVAEYVDGRSRS